MANQHEPPQDTKEFLARWNAATEGVLTERLTEILTRLSERETPDMVGRTKIVETLAPHVLHALQVSTIPGSTVHDAIDYLASLTDLDAGNGAGTL